MSGIWSYDLNFDAVKSLLAALEGVSAEKTKWVRILQNWLLYRDLQLDIRKLAEKWFTDFAIRTNVHIGRHDFETDEENLVSWVHHQMEFTSGIQWDVESRKCIINKYASVRPLLNVDNTQLLLNFLTEEISKGAK